MIRARILTPWSGTGKEGDPYRPQIGDDFKLATTQDVTGQPVASLLPTPNLHVVEITADETTFAAIVAHKSYGPGAVLWSATIGPVPAGGNRQTPHTSAEYQKLTQYVAGKGMLAAHIAQILGSAPKGNREQTEQTMTAWLKNRPKG
jgi:hypothetical protein